MSIATQIAALEAAIEKGVLSITEEGRTVTDGERLKEVAEILATGLLRLHAGGMKKRRILTDNRLDVPAETTPHAVDPDGKEIA